MGDRSARHRYAPGTLLHHETLPEKLWPDGAAVSYRIHYRGIGYEGIGRTISGSVFVPAGDPPPGGWPVVAYAHGTCGLADTTAPSRAGLSKLERRHVGAWLSAGWAVAATDYEGLATPGPHPYLNGEAVLDDVIDAVRAAHGLPHALSPAWIVVGFSQGGHAALFTAITATRYAPELDFRGTIALAPPVHATTIVHLQTREGTGPLTIFTPFLLAGLRTGRPDFDARAFLTPAGRELVDFAAHASLGQMFAAISTATNDHIGTTDLLADRPLIESVLDSCRVPLTRLDRPLYLAAGGADEVIPLEVVDRFAADLRDTGSEITYTVRPGASHAAMLTVAIDEMHRWARDLLERLPAPRYEFDLLDISGDGYLTRDDYDAFALRLVQAAGEPPGSAKARRVRDGYRALWRSVRAAADTDGDGRVSDTEFADWIRCGAEFSVDIMPLARAVIDLAGTGDDVLRPSELERILFGCNLSGDEARAEFDRLDLDENGVISADELVAAIHAFCQEPGENKPGSWLFGRF
ncbi:EF hand domain-containing protein [Nocardia tenerifensis]|uniref:EF hand domain-containing protein n=1 Tax=Nocardia tenerifensis TaxID=228006 RepID=A0A318KGL4_9NOCA|nr:lipase family protein [Nocardia tenerifensis]PXX71402.1 EF hand domain-containing protein [Nocardia tenerifensis]